MLIGLLCLCNSTFAQSDKNKVPLVKIQEIYEQVKTPYKYGLVLAPDGNDKKIDCPSVFRKGNDWYMSYLIFNGRGYETWLANSKDLLHWKSMGKMMSFSADTANWDINQKAGYVGLEDLKWGGSYELQKYDGKYWMSYFGGHERGYEKGALALGMAYTNKDPATAHEWTRLDRPILTPVDSNVAWWDNHMQYKETVIEDKAKLTGHRFVMYYNANGDSVSKTRGAERIGMATSDDMLHWKRFGKNPVLDHGEGITGDPWIQQMGDVYVMFYFRAWWKGKESAIYNSFAASYDLVNWTDWGEDKKLITSSEPYDDQFAHKSCVINWKGVVYHFYCAVDKADQRGIAVATSKDLGKSAVSFVAPPLPKVKK